MKCNTFSESHAQADFNDDDGNNKNDKYHEDKMTTTTMTTKIFFKTIQVSSVILSTRK